MTTDAWGIHLEYEDAFRNKRQSPQSTIDAIRQAMGATDRDEPPPPRSLVIRRGDMCNVGAGEVFLEDGSSLAIESSLPPGLPLGYHQFQPHDQEEAASLIISPGACPLPAGRHSWAWAVQLYATRSQASWGIGDLADLRELARWSKQLGASVLMINPLHAAAPVLPQEVSPYYPTSRSFRNPIYLRIEEIRGAGEAGFKLAELAAAGRALNSQRQIDRDEVFRLKRTALEALFASFAGDARFDAYLDNLGASLSNFATFCAVAEQHGRDYRDWPAEYRHPHNAAVSAFRDQHAKRLRFHAWLQWLIDEQLTAAARELPIMQDLAVGFDPGGADAWMWQDLLARDMSVGAPPDLHNPWGQDWGLPPFIPHKLERAAFEPFVQTIRAALAHAGGLRIDHTMGLFRLFWIPQGGKPTDGAFVTYPAQALLDIVALESHRAGAFVVAEDLGTVQDYMRDAFMKHQMLSYRLLWLEDEAPSTYPERSMAAVTTHDLFTIAGLWNGSDFRHQESIGLQPHREAVDEVMDRITKLTDLVADSPLPEVAMTVHRLLAEANSMVVAATLEDALLVEERPNMPGTTDQWPNWRIALPATIEEIQKHSLPRQIAEVLTKRGGDGETYTRR
ncbi:MAG: 4-alpha-glucanotransferase [Pirellulales bacterium]